MNECTVVVTLFQERLTPEEAPGGQGKKHGIYRHHEPSSEEEAWK
ncbi:MAG TPA: hypothetical protein PK200_11680 [Spirochaetota bacterium]|nr:hypothetical protein [Spirochaetota bacterium]